MLLYPGCSDITNFYLWLPSARHHARYVWYVKQMNSSKLVCSNESAQSVLLDSKQAGATNILTTMKPWVQLLQ